MTTNTRSIAVGVFADRRHAQAAVRELKDAGFREDQIGVIAQHTEESPAGAVTEEHGSHVVEGAVTGVVAGAGVGALWCLGIVTLGIPAIGPVIAGGVFAAILASAAGGAVIAGIAGALIGLGIPEEEAHYYEGEFKSGRTLVTVKDENRYDKAWRTCTATAPTTRRRLQSMGHGRRQRRGPTAARRLTSPLCAKRWLLTGLPRRAPTSLADKRGAFVHWFSRDPQGSACARAPLSGRG